MNVSIDHPTNKTNFTVVEVAGLGLAFSYRTLVGIRQDFGRWKVTQNYWGPTTGKHLNYLDDGNKSERLSSEEFSVLADSLRITVSEIPYV